MGGLPRVFQQVVAIGVLAGIEAECLHQERVEPAAAHEQRRPAVYHGEP